MSNKSMILWLHGIRKCQVNPRIQKCLIDSGRSAGAGKAKLVSKVIDHIRSRRRAHWHISIAIVTRTLVGTQRTSFAVLSSSFLFQRTRRQSRKHWSRPTKKSDRMVLRQTN